ncbi:hypothetical protein CC85DRAFT_303269 [Cutaneotrichosporon oleaginosum]|uniref:Thioredoxin domain-containing protein n=1 Tax=Cutaneotrichosporon oleaginosum TaxID=879819 RepID=A0A0J1B158_9TREE|nr:uncharacterized protein CC85DRAFT_303269 [Cutaneotrichosporon oleaginosum]KLT41334.1 hypothetical protein CC85DRAFT_303269 [Cutaneotrichosporon oleaginosum]TXT06279.1 hypothetical protein COLE_05610 [Cutaneotrichosporon oleaginosum]
MPLIKTSYPQVLNSLRGPTAGRTFLLFYSSIVNGQMWCPDCRAVEGIVEDAFEGDDKPKCAIVWVERDEWKKPDGAERVQWNLRGLPTIIRFEEGAETGRLVEGEMLDGARWSAFLAGK